MLDFFMSTISDVVGLEVDSVFCGNEKVFSKDTSAQVAV